MSLLMLLYIASNQLIVVFRRSSVVVYNTVFVGLANLQEFSNVSRSSQMLTRGKLTYSHELQKPFLVNTFLVKQLKLEQS